MMSFNVAKCLIIHVKFAQASYGSWKEVYPCFTHNWHPAGQNTQSTQTSPTRFHQNHPSPRQLSPRQLSHTQFSPVQLSPEHVSPPTTSARAQSPRQLSPRTRHYVPGMAEEELEERRREAGWYPGCEDETEEEEPEFCEFFRKLAIDTEERIRQSQREYEEEYDNYFVARFAFH